MIAHRVLLLAATALAVGLGSTGASVIVERADGIVGLAPGDAIVGWELRDAAGAAGEAGTVADPFELLSLLRDRAPRGGLHLLTRDGAVAWPARGGELQPEPRLAEPAMSRYREAVGLLAAEHPERRTAGRELLAELMAAATEADSRAWLGYRLALAHEADGDAAAAGEVLAAAAEADRLPPLVAALLRSQLSRHLFTRRLSAEALPQAEMAVAALAAAGEWPVLGAALEVERAMALRSVGRLAEAEAAFAPALAALAERASESELRAWALLQGANSAWLADDLELAEERYRSALSIQERLGAPAQVALNGLAILASTRGDSAGAERLYHRALAAAPDERARATYRGNLATLYRNRGELERARQIYQELITFHTAAGDPRSTFVHAAAIGGLARTERSLGDLEAAEALARRAAEMFMERVPGSISAADSLALLGSVLHAAGKLDEAAEVLARSLQVAAAARPEGLSVADAHAALGALALDRKELAEAEEHYLRALDLVRAMAPGTRLEAEVVHGLGRVEEARERPQAALERYRRAIATLQALRGRLGGAHESRAGFTSLHQELYWPALDLLAAGGRAADAFDLLESYRAHNLLELLAERELTFDLDLPAETARQRLALDRRHDTLLAKLDAAAVEERPALREELARLRLRQQEIAERIRSAAPRVDALHHPRPVRIGALGTSLPSGALLLSYVVGPERAWLLALGPGERPVTAFAVGAGRGELGQAVANHRRLSSVPSGRPASLEQAGARLSRLLLEPVADRLAAATSVVVIPDGPLHLLAWSALPDPAEPGQPVIARRPVALAASLTVLQELRETTVAGTRPWMGFADPTGGGAGREDAVQVALRSGVDLGRLPWSREEANRVGAMFGDQAVIYHGSEATEERLLAAAPAAHRLHLACHAVVDADLPLESGLVLAPPAEGPATAGDNGFLQVWEIYQRLRLDADLVTLSACESGLGREVSGEGVLGLTRAFHFAGARTVMSSLWKVSDEATMELMTAFYRHLLDGASKPEALRQAQLGLLRGAGGEGTARYRHPFYWAAFQVHGAWD